jgi:RecG-like helicase
VAAPPPGTDPIGSLRQPGHATVQGRLHATETRSGKAATTTVLTFEVGDSTGQLTAVFYGRAQITSAEPGTRIRLHGTVGISPDGHPAMINPAYELLS